MTDWYLLAGPYTWADATCRLSSPKSLEEGVLRRYAAMHFGCLDSGEADILETTSKPHSGKLMGHPPRILNGREVYEEAVPIASLEGLPWALQIQFQYAPELRRWLLGSPHEYNILRVLATYDFEGCLHNPYYDYTHCWEELFDEEAIYSALDEALW